LHRVTAVGVIRLALLLATAKNEGASSHVSEQSVAEELLLIRLRAGDIRSKGKIAGREGYQAMDSLDWCDAMLAEDRDHPVVRPDRFDGKFWYDVAIPKASVLSFWPSNPAEPPQLPAQSAYAADSSGKDDDAVRPKDTIAEMERRERLANQWAQRMYQSADWIKFSRIADWCARETGKIDDRGPDYKRLTGTAYRQLWESLKAGDFGTGRRTRVLYPIGALVSGVRPFIRMTPQIMGLAPYGEGLIEILRECWISRDLAGSWFAGKRLQLPPWLAGEMSRESSPVALTACKPMRNQRGRPPVKMQKATATMVAAVTQGKLSVDGLMELRQKQLSDLYPGAKRTILVAARKNAEKQLAAISNSDKKATNDK
jgi:hypothetical protein